MWFLRKNASYKIFIVTWRTGPSSLGLIYAPAYIKPVNSKKCMVFSGVDFRTLLKYQENKKTANKKECKDQIYLTLLLQLFCLVASSVRIFLKKQEKLI